MTSPTHVPLLRFALVSACIVALLVMPAATPPVAARTPQGPAGPASERGRL